ncbi:hypothetical protein [Desulfosporosinus sp. SB140]|uniref:hypothetical protein n=1 Tax=Desulfosporosinus paludis TaxID=3115649 RepID=UPI00388E2E52
MQQINTQFSNKIKDTKINYVKFGTDELLTLRLQIEDILIGVRENNFDSSTGAPIIIGLMTLLSTMAIAFVVSVPNMAISVVVGSLNFQKIDTKKANDILDNLFKKSLQNTYGYLWKLYIPTALTISIIGILAYILFRHRIHRLKMYNRELEVINMILAERIESGRTALKTAIMNARTLQVSKKVGTVVGNVTQITYDIFQIAITGAETTLNNSASETQAQIDAAVTALTTATTTFNNAVNKVDTTALKTAITNARTLKASKTVGTADGNVTQATCDVFQIAITSAETTLNKSTSETQAQIDAAVIALERMKVLAFG